MEIPVDESVVNKIDFNCEGNFRKAIKIMYIIERAKTTNPQLSMPTSIWGEIYDLQRPRFEFRKPVQQTL